MTEEAVPLHPFADGELRLATLNYESQEWLTRALHEAFQLSSLSIEDLARQLEISVDEAREWISGDFDLTMSELRQLANAIDARVTYRVDTMYNRMDEWIRQVETFAWQEVPWRMVPEATA